MFFDLHRAMVRKGEHETARLDEFAFRLRIRTMRELARAIGQEPEALVRLALQHADETLASHLPPEATAARLEAARARAHASLIAEFGDPTPHRLG
jgi:hypothetical protein